MQKKIWIASVIMLGMFCGFEIYHQTGMVHSTRKNGYGCICHNFDPTPGVNVWISGPDSLQAGAESIYTISVSKPANIAAGFNVASYLGALGIADSLGTTLDRESSTDSLELTHTFPRMRNENDTISWIFKYTAPQAVGFVDTLYSVANAVNNDTLPGPEDEWNFGENFFVRVVGPTSVGVPAEVGGYHLSQNYPNPFNPSTSIRYEIPERGRVELRVFDLAGQEIAVLVNSEQSAGTHEVRFESAPAEELSSGVYFYRLVVTPFQSNAAPFVSVKKMLVIK